MLGEDILLEDSEKGQTDGTESPSVARRERDREAPKPGRIPNGTISIVAPAFWVTSSSTGPDIALTPWHLSNGERGGQCLNEFLFLWRVIFCVYSAKIVQRLIIQGILESVQTKRVF